MFRNLSGGQQQRILLARALAADRTDMLVLDEPTAGMDAASEAAILEFLRDLNRTQGVTMLIVTHMLPIVLNLATSIMLLGANRSSTAPWTKCSAKIACPSSTACRCIWASSPDSGRWS